MVRDAEIEAVEARALRIPTDTPESDGTLRWSSTTIVICRVAAGGTTGIGYTYAHAVAASLIEQTLRDCLLGRSAFMVKAHWMHMRRSLRNIGEPGVGSMALSAVDMALWDWLARRTGEPLCHVLGTYRSAVPAYGSGGFTSYSVGRVQRQLGELKARGFAAFKIKVGREPVRDVERVRAAAGSARYSR